MGELSLVSRLQLDIAQFQRAIRRAERDVDRFDAEVRQGTRGATRALDSLAGSTRDLGVGFGVATRGVTEFGRSAERETRDVSDILESAARDTRQLGDEFDRAEREARDFTDGAERGTRALRRELEDIQDDTAAIGRSFNRADRESRQLWQRAQAGGRATERVLESISGDTRRIADGFDRAERSLRDFVQQASRGGRRAQASTGGLLSSVRGLGQNFLSLKALGVGAFGAIAVAGTRASIRTAESFRGLEITFSTILGGAERAGDELAFLRAEANRVGTAFLPLAQSATGLFAAFEGTALQGQRTREVFASVIQASRVLNLSLDDTRGILRALRQTASRGVVSLEELNQVSERLPNALRVFAEATGIAESEFQKLVSTGTVGAERLFQGLPEVLNRQFSPGIEAASQTFSAATGRFATGTQDISRAFGRLITDSNLVISSLNAVGAAFTSVANTLNPDPLVEQSNEINRLTEEVRILEGNLSAVMPGPFSAVMQVRTADARRLTEATRELTNALDLQFQEFEGLGGSAAQGSVALRQAEASAKRVAAEAQKAAKETEAFGDALSNLAGVESVAALETRLAGLGRLLQTADVPGEIAAINTAIRDTQDAIRELRVGPLVAGLSDTASTLAEAFAELQLEIDGSTESIDDMAAAGISAAGRVDPLIQGLGMTWAELENTINGVANSSEEAIGDMAEDTIRFLERTRRETQETEEAFRRLTGLRPTREIAEDFALLESALAGANTAREIRAIEDAMAELQEEALNIGRNTSIALAEIRTGTSQLVDDFIEGEITSLRDLEDAFTDTLRRIASEIAQAEIDRLITRSITSALGGLSLEGSGGGGTAGTTPQSQRTQETRSGVGSQQQQQAGASESASAVPLVGAAIGLFNLGFLGGQALRGLFTKTRQVEAAFTTIPDNIVGDLRSRFPDFAGRISGPLGDVIITDIDEAGTRVARELGQFVRDVDRAVVGFLNESQREAARRGIVFEEFDQRFGRNVDPDNLANLFVDRFRQVVQAAAEATPQALAGSTRLLSSRIFSGVDVDDLSAVQQRADEFGEVFQAITRLATGARVTESSEALAVIENQFGLLADAAEAFGLNANLAVQAGIDAANGLRREFQRGIVDSLLGITDPIALANVQLERQRVSLLEEADALSLTTAQIDRLVVTERGLLNIRREQQVQARASQVDLLRERAEAIADPVRANNEFLRELDEFRGNASSVESDIAAANLSLIQEIAAAESALASLDQERRLLNREATETLGPSAGDRERASALFEQSRNIIRLMTEQRGIIRDLNAERARLPDFAGEIERGTRRVAQNFIQQFRDEARGITDPLGLESIQLERAFGLALDAARELQRESGLPGLEAAVINLFDLQRETLNAQIDAADAQERAAQLTAIQAPLQPIESFLSSLEIGAGFLTPRDVLNNTQAAFERALEGQDVGAVVNLGQQLLDISREVNTSSPAFFDTLGNVQSQVLSFADAIAANVTSLNDVNDSVERQTAAVVNLLEDLLQRAVENNTSNVNIRNLLELTLAGAS